MITWIYQIGYKVIFVLLLCVSCKKSVQKGIESIDIGLDQIEVPSTNLFDQMEIHPLGGDAYPVIFEITRGRSNGRQYLFADGNYDGNLILCDKNGENLSRINQKGSQPTSYLELWDFELDTAGHIGVYDFQRQVLLTYHVNGDFINKFSIGYNFLRFTWFENNLILFTAKHANYVNNKSINFDLLWISPEGEITQSLIPFDENKFKSVRMHSSNPFLRNQSQLFFNDILSDTVYRIQNDTIIPQYCFTYPNPMNYAYFLKDGHEEFVKSCIEKDARLRNKSFGATVKAISDKFIIYSFNSNFKKHNGIYSIASGNNRVFESHSLGNIDMLDPFFVDDNKFVVVVPMYLVKDILPDVDVRFTDPEQPMLLKYSIRDF